MSFVLVHASTVSALNRAFSCSSARRCRWSRLTAASVVTKTSMVARLGAIIPTPFAHPPTRKPPASAVACLSTVSVVMIARAKSEPPSGVNAPVRIGRAASSGSTWTGSPITPVEHGRTSAVSTPSAAAAAETIVCASASPRSPVAAFAWPLLTITARP